MTELKGHKTLNQTRRETEERVRQRNLQDRGASNVVPLRQPTARPAFRWPPLRPNALMLWSGIIAALVVVYLVQRAF